MNIQASTIERRTPRIRAPHLLFVALQAIAAGAAWAAASGGQVLRAFALSSVMLGMVMPLLASLEAGLLAMVLFEPFRGLLRRMQYLAVPYSTSEPIHLLTPMAALFAFTVVLHKHRLSIFMATPVSKGVTLLALICLVQVFNPLQGGLFVGLSGALFILVPMAWFYFGQHAAADFMPRVLKAIVILGMIASAWGVYQMLAGYPEFELYWIRNTDNYESIAVYNVTRAIATFSNAEEWGRYVELGCIIAVGLAISRSAGRSRLAWGLCAAVLAVMLTLTGQRASIFGLFLGLTVLFLAGAKTWGSVVVRITTLSLALACFLFASFRFAEDDTSPKGGEGVSTILSHTTKGTLNPTNEYSLSARLDTWSEVLFKTIPSNPIGAGLGGTTVSGTRNDQNQRPIDNHFFSIAIGAGVPAALLLVWIFWRSMRISMQLCRKHDRDTNEFTYYRIAMALIAALILNNFFGTSFVIYSVAPIGWLLIGWLSARGTELTAPTTRDAVRAGYKKKSQLAV